MNGQDEVSHVSMSRLCVRELRETLVFIYLYQYVVLCFLFILFLLRFCAVEQVVENEILSKRLVSIVLYYFISFTLEEPMYIQWFSDAVEGLRCSRDKWIFINIKLDPTSRRPEYLLPTRCFILFFIPFPIIHSGS